MASVYECERRVFGGVRGWRAEKKSTFSAGSGSVGNDKLVLDGGLLKVCCCRCCSQASYHEQIIDSVVVKHFNFNKVVSFFFLFFFCIDPPMFLC